MTDLYFDVPRQNRTTSCPRCGQTATDRMVRRTNTQPTYPSSGRITVRLLGAGFALVIVAYLAFVGALTVAAQHTV